MRLQKKELYEILKNLNVITNEKCKEFESITFRNSHWLENNKNLKIWANGINYIMVENYYYNEDYEKKIIKETTFIRKNGQWEKYHERNHK